MNKDMASNLVLIVAFLLIGIGVLRFLTSGPGEGGTPSIAVGVTFLAVAIATRKKNANG